MREGVKSCGCLNLVVVAVLATLLICASPAQATWAPGADVVQVKIEASAGDEKGGVTWFFPPDLTIAGRYDWSLPETRSIPGMNGPLATIEGLTVGFDADPAVSLGFAVTAGAAPVNFTISSANLVFSSLANPQAYATAQIGVTDNNGNGATATGLQTGGTVYEARYNGSVAWADLVGSVTADPGSSATDEGRKPMLPTFWETIPDSLTSIAAEYKFTLTANDSASGTSHFEVVPEPCLVCFLTIGGLVLLRRARG